MAPTPERTGDEKDLPSFDEVLSAQPIPQPSPSPASTGGASAYTPPVPAPDEPFASDAREEGAGAQIPASLAEYGIEPVEASSDGAHVHATAFPIAPPPTQPAGSGYERGGEVNPEDYPHPTPREDAPSTHQIPRVRPLREAPIPAPPSEGPTEVMTPVAPAPGAAQTPGSRPGVQAGGFASAWDSSAPGSGTPAFNQSAGGQSWQSRSYRQRPPYQPMPMPVRPARPRRPGPGSSLSLAVLGLGLLTAAGVWYATATHHLGLLQGQFILIGILVALLGAGIVVSGLRRRHGGWMTVLGWPVLFVVAIPALATASIVPTSLARMPFESLRNATTATSSTVTWQELTASASSGSVTRNKDIGDLTLDLRGMPATEASKLSTITTHLDVGTLRIKTDTDQRVEVRADVDMGAIDSQVSRAWTVNGRQMNQDDEGPRTYDATGKTIPAYSNSSGGLNTKRTLASPNSDDQRPQITINASVDTGTINIEERSNTASWYGNVEEPVWIVSMWFDEKGDAHGDDLPVPGMNHPAITAKDAETCIRTAHESVDADDRSEDVGWSNLSDLTSAERTSYDSCVQRTLSGQGAAQPSASPSPSGAAAATPSPTPTKQSATASPTAG